MLSLRDKPKSKGGIRMDLQYTLQHDAFQLKNVPRTLRGVARVVQKLMKTLYQTHFPDAENRRPGPNPEVSRLRPSHYRVASRIHRGSQRNLGICTLESRTCRDLSRFTRAVAFQSSQTQPLGSE